MGKPTAAFAAETTKAINSLVARCQYRHFITRRVEFVLLFDVLALWNAEPIPLGSAKSKKKQNLCDLCGSAVNNLLSNLHKPVRF